jgi:hypothetical protein
LHREWGLPAGGTFPLLPHSVCYRCLRSSHTSTTRPSTPFLLRSRISPFSPRPLPQTSPLISCSLLDDDSVALDLAVAAILSPFASLWRRFDTAWIRRAQSSKRRPFQEDDASSHRYSPSSSSIITSSSCESGHIHAPTAAVKTEPEFLRFSHHGSRLPHALPDAGLIVQGLSGAGSTG